jgi:hypothetical protein
LHGGYATMAGIISLLISGVPDKRWSLTTVVFAQFVSDVFSGCGHLLAPLSRVRSRRIPLMGLSL